jgi:hypothetical protein
VSYQQQQLQWQIEERHRQQVAELLAQQQRELDELNILNARQWDNLARCQEEMHEESGH